jgi:hypothetical protein
LDHIYQEHDGGTTSQSIGETVEEVLGLPRSNGFHWVLHNALDLDMAHSQKRGNDNDNVNDPSGFGFDATGVGGPLHAQNFAQHASCSQKAITLLASGGGDVEQESPHPQSSACVGLLLVLEGTVEVQFKSAGTRAVVLKAGAGDAVAWDASTATALPHVVGVSPKKKAVVMRRWYHSGRARGVLGGWEDQIVCGWFDKKGAKIKSASASGRAASTTTSCVYNVFAPGRVNATLVAYKVCGLT